MSKPTQSSAHRNSRPEQTLSAAENDRAIHQAIAQLTTGDFHSKWNAAKQFSKRLDNWGDRPAEPLIQRLQIESDPDNQCFLVRALSQFEQPAVVEAIAHLLVTTPAETVQTEATKALTALGNSAIGPLAQLLASNRLPQQILATRALAHIRRTAVIDPLLSVATHPNGQLRAIALEALGSFHDPRITPLLIAAIQDEPAIAQEAIRTLGRRSDLVSKTDLATPLSQALESPHEAVAKESAIALGRLRTPTAIRSLSALLSQPKPTPVKIAAVRALGWIGSAAAIEALAEAFSYEAPVIMPDVQQEIARSLSQVNNADLRTIATPPLLNWLSTYAAAQNQSQRHAAASRIDTFSLKQSIITALARLSARSALDSLVQTLSDPDPRIRIHSLSALKQIDPNAAQVKVQDYLSDRTLSEQQRQAVLESLSAW